MEKIRRSPDCRGDGRRGPYPPERAGDNAAGPRGPGGAIPDPGPEPDPTPKPTLIYIIFLLPQTASGFRLLIAPIIHPDQKPFIHLQSPLQAGFKASIVIIVLNDVAGI